MNLSFKTKFEDGTPTDFIPRIVRGFEKHLSAKEVEMNFSSTDWKEMSKRWNSWIANNNGKPMPGKNPYDKSWQKMATWNDLPYGYRDKDKRLSLLCKGSLCKCSGDNHKI